MSFSFNPLTDEQISAIQNRDLLSDGVYPFTVKNAEQQHSKSGNPMLKITIGVLASENDERNIKDYLLATDQMMFKLKHFCESIGLGDKYAKGTFSETDCIGRSGKVKIGTQKGAKKEDGSGFYSDRNSVKDYVLPDSLQKPLIDPDFNDDIKF
jgi:uncharacterized protein DUF669